MSSPGEIPISAPYLFEDPSVRHSCVAQLRLESHFYLSQDSNAGQHYVLLQLACLSGMMTSLVSDVKGILGPFCDQVWVSVTPTAPELANVPAVADSFRPLATGTSMTQQAGAEDTTGLAIPITFHGAGVTPSVQHKGTSSIGLTMDNCVQFDNVAASEGPSTAKFKLSLVHWGVLGGIYDPRQILHKDQKQLPNSASDGLLLRVAHEALPTVRWRINSPLSSGTKCPFTVHLGGRFTRLYKRQWWHFRTPYKAVHAELDATAEQKDVVF